MLAAARTIRVGELVLVLSDGSHHLLRGELPGPRASLVVHRQHLARRMAAGGLLGFCEAYLDEDWSSPDRSALFDLALLNRRELENMLAGRWWSRLFALVAHGFRRNSRAGSRRNIARHYDLGNDFYRQWLDSSMTYSSGIFADPKTDVDLEAAQRRKYAAIVEALDIRPGHRLLEIGCGWGGFAVFAAGEIGAHTTAVTISRAQYDEAARRIAEAGLNDRIALRLADYRDLRGSYDRVVSIEMFEAVGQTYWPVYFASLRDRLEPGGQALLQIITIAEECWADYRRNPDFIQTHVFPGGMLPTLDVLRAETDRAGLAWQSCRGFGSDYARTLELWQRRFQHAWPEIASQGFDARFKRTWELYLDYCAAGFRAKTTDVVHLRLDRP
ncbi:MAG: cyclopropane-fatty-acyl-phospholipid synthase family protein [Rhodospirillaceae bacterium]